uniref:Aspartyl protease n=1 Tax=Marseillevirus LCMAC103 TaxID=2506604 RepID=A0A481YVN3_9VIRU|nr:MAG: hypothetical protein LCMAC103_03030 [Marseillevirus LCMAC103]
MRAHIAFSLLVAVAAILVVAAALFASPQHGTPFGGGRAPADVRLGRALGKVRHIRRRKTGPPKAPRPPLRETYTLPLSMDVDPGPLVLMAAMPLEVETRSRGTVVLQTQVDTGSQFLVVTGDTCKNCDRSLGAFPTSEPGRERGTEQHFTYGIGDYTGSYYQTRLAIDGATIPLELAVATASAPCEGGGLHCNVSIGGLLPAHASAGEHDRSFLDQVLATLGGQHRHSFVLDFRAGAEKIVFGAEDAAGVKVPQVSARRAANLVGVGGIPYYLVEVRGVTFRADRGGEVRVDMPRHAILDCGSTSIVCAPRAAAAAARKIHRAAKGGAGTLYIDLGKARLAARIHSPEFATTAIMPVDVFDEPPLDKVWVIGLIAMLGNVITHNVQDRYYTFRRPEPYHV